MARSIPSTLYRRAFLSTQRCTLQIATRGMDKRDGQALRLKYEQKEGCDFALVVDGAELHVHKFVLELRCDYFKSMLRGENTEVAEGKCSMQRPSLGERAVTTPFINVVKIFVQFLYSDELRFPIDASDAEISAIVDELLWAADYYVVSSLSVECARVLALVERKADFVKFRQYVRHTHTITSPTNNIRRNTTTKIKFDKHISRTVFLSCRTATAGPRK